MTDRADSGYVRVTVHTYVDVRVFSTPAGEGVHDGRRGFWEGVGGRYSRSIQARSIRLMNGLITADKHWLEIRGVAEEDGRGSRMLCCGALLYLNKTNQQLFIHPVTLSALGVPRMPRKKEHNQQLDFMVEDI